MTERFSVKQVMFDGYCIHDALDDTYYDYDKFEMEQLCMKINHIIDANNDLTMKIIMILDFVKEKGTVTHEEMKEFWNSEVMNCE